MTTQKKYELLQNDTINHNGRTLYRIKAITTFGTVFAGTLGGYIEKESNLKHLGNAWVYDNAKVYDSAEVYGNAKVYDSAEVYGNAEVWGSAEVYGNAKVWGNAEVWGSAEVYGNAEVWGSAKVWGNAEVWGSAEVYGNAKVYDSAEVWGSAKVRSFAVLSERKMIFWASNVGTENGTLTVYNGKDGLLVTRGCFTGTVEEFLAKSDEVHDEKTKREYQLLIEVAKSRILGEAT
ncbi:TPA: polymer-forming cytoskeletal protein [Mannheimia haemolytica]|uniref:polymer-forming cytoskeletal protein n=1 Tax=Mannheimia haemolytica TaxID=75985 RepID=UPI0011BBEB23|nr:polymer-forming cytoskeletal protein [Mannheimia haemolytica]MDW0372203.1 polymer-forming cytoskeletal protein [Mannheimia haemolytica]MDW0390697.1 polymer-forming cytoskeletal protein [Mannheimia haemolytica]MDW0393178.1 polymer-forming cytoskeletal protein [Mannheimia haemolytica]MDW0403717.1 polymer-forming cytoskeletal protein [Mannheimia haemolytica]MDW0419499.1 polymer-forming cytoskeletal protein [Mannheimia haemolytica]